MDYSKEIKKLLNDLKTMGFNRSDIESRIGIAENSISQALSRNGNERMLKTITLFKEWAILHKANGDQVLEEPVPSYETTTDKILAHQVKLIESMKMQADTCNRILSKMADSVETKVDILDLSLTDALARIESLSMNMKSGRHVVLKSLARLEGKPEAQLLAEADSINASLLREQIGKQNKKGDKRS